MALRSPQYIFGDFSPDEFNQFFVTPRASVELPPYGGTVLCGAQAAGDLPDGHDYQRIEFGVNEVIEPSDTLPRTPNYSISSTLNPQAPEFILSCTTSKKLPDDIDKEVNYSSANCQYPGPALALDGGSHAEAEALENDGVSGGLGQRERKKKKKRPPGYYSYLKDGGEGGPSAEALVNGHAGPAVLNSVGAEDVDLMGDVPTAGTPRTWGSPQDATDFVSDAGPAGAFLGALDGGARTAGQPEGCPGADSEASCLPAEAGRDTLLRTAVAQPSVGTDTTENLGVTNGQILESLGEGTAANGVELHTVESADSDPAKAESAPPSADAPASAVGTVPASQPAKSWASLFHDSKPSSSPVVSVETKYSPPATSPLVSEKQAEVKEGLVPVSEDPVAIKIAELLENVTLIHKPVSLQPRGLINKGNWCYINATLQALVACPPMYHLMKFIPLYSKVQRPCTSTPMIDSFVRLMNEFTNMPVPPKPRQALGDKIVRDIRPGAAFEPTYIYRLLTVIKSSLSEKGRQEDAEEYLGFILNGLHEEMLNLKKLLSPNNEKLTISNGPKSHSVNEDEQEEPGEGSEDEWEQVGPRNKTSVTRQADFVQTPITGIFGGHIRSVVYQQSSKESATLQPFFTLQLDIQSDKIRTVQDALESLVARESVQGYTTKTKQEVEISRRVTLEKLPPVLVLHLKRFVYEKTGGCQKLIKNIEYPVDLEISKELLSPGVKSKNFKCHRTYRLFAEHESAQLSQAPRPPITPCPHCQSGAMSCVLTGVVPLGLVLLLCGAQGFFLPNVTHLEKLLSKYQQDQPHSRARRAISRTDREEILMLHNKLRGQVSPPASNMEYMTWDEELEKSATAWAQECIWEHGPTSLLVSIGQNLAVHWGRYRSPGSHVQSWYDEVKDYTYPYPHECNPWCPERCSGLMCTHYTQIVWATTNKIGCAVNTCQRMNVWGDVWENAVYLVCNYSPKGNWIGEAPYRTGQPCSECPAKYGGGCKNNLCYQETHGQEPETDDMNEVEMAPIPDEKHVWISPRVIKPTKPKKDSPVNYMTQVVKCDTKMKDKCKGSTCNRYQCPAGCLHSGAKIFGTLFYESASSICRAAIHYGILDDRGGLVDVTRNGKVPFFVKSERNGVQSLSKYKASSSFTVSTVKVQDLDCYTTVAQLCPYEKPGTHCPRVHCPAHCRDEPSYWAPVFGSNIYADTSSICKTAVHAGVIRNESGGYVDVMPVDKKKAYVGSLRNGVQSESLRTLRDGKAFRIFAVRQ